MHGADQRLSTSTNSGYETSTRNVNSTKSAKVSEVAVKNAKSMHSADQRLSTSSKSYESSSTKKHDLDSCSNTESLKGATSVHSADQRVSSSSKSYKSSTTKNDTESRSNPETLMVAKPADQRSSGSHENPQHPKECTCM